MDVVQTGAYFMCVDVDVICMLFRLVVHNMLEKVDSYLWAKKPVHLTPQVCSGSVFLCLSVCLPVCVCVCRDVCVCV